MLVTLAGSLVAVLALAGIARWLRLGHDIRLDADEAAAAAEGALAGFDATRVVIASDGAGALVIGHDARLAVVKRHGARAAVGAIVDTGERRFGTVTLADVDALDLRRMAR